MQAHRTIIFDELRNFMHAKSAELTLRQRTKTAAMYRVLQLKNDMHEFLQSSSIES